ncbi:histidine kinase [Mucilaginibacter sp. PAMB04274]|uniref:sensor histidine kinase n=1 Tax=Mucilaginibacter sp. PAMB04274 TaxID=3138568 RepID=UPI0031F6A6FE
MKGDYSYYSGSFLKLNRNNAAIGVIVGLCLCAVQSVFRERIMATKDILMTIMFSIVITLSITNSVYLYQRFLKPKKKVNLWQFILVYYVCNLLGMFIGVELSYFFVSLIFHLKYVPLAHFNDYKFTFIVVLIVGTIIYFYMAQKATMNAQIKEKELDLARLKQLKTQAELQTLQSKINPHFLYNSLNSIASLIHEDADKAEDMTLKLSKLFRYSINSQQENMALVKDEMEIVNTYLDIEKVRFGDRISFNSSIDNNLLDKRIPRFLIQPLVENALKHGLNHTAKNGILEVNLKQQNNKLIIEVVDNGPPFPDELNMGYGMQSTYDKLNLLYGEGYEMQLINTPRKHIFLSLPII